jgi:hypothetical protein
VQAALIEQEYRQERHDGPRETLPAGTVIDHPDAWQLVVRGIALSHDDECRAKVTATATEDQLQAARDRQAEVRLGIQPVTEETDGE